MRQPRSFAAGALVVAVAVVLLSASNTASQPRPVPGAGVARPGSVSYRVAFTGSGSATRAFPPVTGGTTFTSRISWTLIYQVTVPVPAGLPYSTWAPLRGSGVDGGSTGVATASGLEIEPGCEQIRFSLDPTQQGGTFVERGAVTVGIELTVPGFAQGALLRYSPSQCTSPFPIGSGGDGCPTPAELTTAAVSLDPSHATRTWRLSARCSVADQGQTADWSGSVTVTRFSVQRERAGDVFFASGNTRQKIGRVAVAPARGRWYVYGVRCPDCGLLGYVSRSSSRRWLVYCAATQTSYNQIGFVVADSATRWDIYLTAPCPGETIVQGGVGYITGSSDGRWEIYAGYSPTGYVDGGPGGPAAGAALLLLLR